MLDDCLDGENRKMESKINASVPNSSWRAGLADPLMLYGDLLLGRTLV